MNEPRPDGRDPAGLLRLHRRAADGAPGGSGVTESLSHLPPARPSAQEIEAAARALYADNEVGEWEDANLDTLLQYRRAAKVALESYAGAQRTRHMCGLPHEHASVHCCEECGAKWSDI